jgi:glycosyltransferase involved in cell wall biosynthesis
MAVRGDAADVIRRAGAGVTCLPEDDAEMADAIVKLAHTHPEELEAMGARGRAAYMEMMSLEVGGASTEALLRQASRG